VGILGQGYAYDTAYAGDISKISADEIGRAAKEIMGQPSVTVRVLSKGPVSVSP